MLQGILHRQFGFTDAAHSCDRRHRDSMVLLERSMQFRKLLLSTHKMSRA
jgi:hypothetical protein